MTKKDEILQVTFKHFAKRGYSVVLSDIAKDVMIKTPSLYSHFGSKEDIIFAMVEKEIAYYRDFLETIHEVHRSKAFEDRLRALFFDIIHYFKTGDRLRFWRNILMIDHDVLRPKCNALVFQMEIDHLKKLEAVFEERYKPQGVEQEGVEGQALQFLALIQGALEVELLFYDSEIKAESYIQKIWLAYITQ